jgi:hypothetical protein
VCGNKQSMCYSVWYTYLSTGIKRLNLLSSADKNILSLMQFLFWGVFFIPAVRCYRYFGGNFCLHSQGRSDFPIHFDPKDVRSRFLRNTDNTPNRYFAYIPKTGLKLKVIHRHYQLNVSLFQFNMFAVFHFQE